MTDDAELCTCGHSRREHSTRSDHAERIPGINLPPWCHLCHAECIYCPPDEDEDDLAEPELTAEEARDLADDLGTQLYRAQDALAFVEECCVIAEREGRTITVADVRTWLKGAQCRRQLAADPGLVVDPAAPPVHLVTWTGPANNGEQSPRTIPDNPPTSSNSPDNPHIYLSTGCHHGRHDYCSNVDGLAGPKTSAQCKFCAAPCRCPCHAVAF